MAFLTIIYSPKMNDLLKYKDKATHWLPEEFKSTKDIYQPLNVICTTKNTMIDFVQVLIQAGELNCSEVIWIDVSASRVSIMYFFGADGYVNNFFSF